jgi:hypothetical protein
MISPAKHKRQSQRVDIDKDRRSPKHRNIQLQKHDDNLSNTNNVESLTNHTSHNIFRWKCRRTNCWSERERNIEKKYIENYYYNLKRLFFILHPSTNMCSSKSFLLSSPSHTNVISIIIFPFHLEDGL